MADKSVQILRNNELSAISTGLRRATMHLGRRLRHERARDALSSTKLSVLGALQRRGELSPGELSDADRIQPQSLTRTLAALQADGLIARRSDPADRRRSLVALTARGRDAQEHDMAQRDRWLVAQLGRLTPAELTVLALAAELMERIADDQT